MLSYPIKAGMPLYGDTPEPCIKPQSRIAKGYISNSYMISVHNHTGTHVDAPNHFIDNGKTISQYSLDELIFKNPVIIDCPKDSATLINPDDLRHASQKLRIGDCLLLRTGFGRFRGEEKYRTHNPGISPETIVWIRKYYPGVRCIGIDSISISSFQHRNEGREAHRAAFIEQKGLGKPLLLIEDMNIDILSGESIEMMIVLPWQIDGLDSAPCNIIGSIKDRL
ncbi:MAG: cyclase family protein [Candidatus Methanoperedens sp.]|nr:cyclase family protein [Candidatus Methanoperedens sp.]MCZ7394909.1 cyclase family protein [Candidatus Methanoperedens sp.]